MTDLVHQGHTGGNAVAAKHITFAYNDLGQTIAMTRYQSAGTTNLVATSTSTYDNANRHASLMHAQGSTTLAGYAWEKALQRIAEFN